MSLDHVCSVCGTKAKEWRTIPGFEMYEASNVGGLVRNKKRLNKVLKQCINTRRQYYTYGLMRPGIKTGQCVLVHRLIGKTWLQEPDDARKNIIKFKDGNRFHCCVSNLEWISRKTVCKSKNTPRKRPTRPVWRLSSKDGSLKEAFPSCQMAGHVMHERGHAKTAVSATNRIRQAIYQQKELFGCCWRYDSHQDNSIEGEVWKKCQDFANMEVSNKGRVAYGLNGQRTVSYGLTNGKRRVVLEPKTRRKVAIHRLVAQEFLPGWDPSFCVLHLDQNPENNCAENLFMTRCRNQQWRKRKKSEANDDD